jgi:hypothetical protein
MIRKKRALASLLLVLTVPLAPTARADVVTDWNATTQAAILATPGAQPGLFYPLVHVAIYDAVNAIDGRYSTFAVRPASNPRGASREAAAAAAAHRTLATLLPGQLSLVDTALASSLAAIPDGPAKTRGIAVGEEVAQAWLAVRANDGRNNVVPYAFDFAPGSYQQTPGGPPMPAAPFMAQVQPFAMSTPSQFRAYGPPDLSSLSYAEDLRLTRALGSSVSTTRTARQTEVALFHTESPVTFWSRNLRDLAVARHLGISDSARLFAMVFVGYGDATIACWDSKYHYNRWRPVTAIRSADVDGNPATSADPLWSPAMPTPGHPEYPAAHACVSAAVAELVAEFFGRDRVRLTLSSSVAGTVPHVFHDTDEIIEEVIWARVYGGMHFLSSGRHGATIGRKVAHQISSGYFQPVGRH